MIRYEGSTILVTFVMKKGDYLAQLLDSLISSKKKCSIYCYSLQETIQFCRKSSILSKTMCYLKLVYRKQCTLGTPEKQRKSFFSCTYINMAWYTGFYL